MVSRWTLALILLVIVGGFMAWFAPLELITCEVEFGVQECYITEDDIETTVIRVATAAGALTAVGAGFGLLGLWILAHRGRDSEAGE